MLNFAIIILALLPFTYPTICRMNYHNFRNRIVLTAAVLGATFNATALDLPTRMVNGNVCYYYEVQPKETVYSLARRFGFTKAQIIHYNPSVADGLRAGQTLYFPKDEVDALPSTPKHQSKQSTPANNVTSPANTTVSCHLVKKGETIYGISRQYDISEADLIAANPRLETVGLKYGTVLTIPAKEPQPTYEYTPKSLSTPASTSVYSTPKSEYSVTADATEPKNTTTTASTYESPVFTTASTTTVYVENIASGDTIESKNSYGNNMSAPQVEDPTLLTPSEATMPDIESQPDTLRMTVMLPFMLSAQQPDKQAQLYTEFYRGLLLAADSLRNHGNPLIISAYDTAASIDTVNSILSHPEVAKSTVIIAPDDDLQLGRIASFASENGAKVFNAFAVKSTLYHNNAAMMQANIPHSDMYDTAVAGILKEYPDYTLAMLVPQEGGKTDKAEFQSRLRSKAMADGREIVEVTYSGMLRQADLEKLIANKKYIFIPSSGTQTEFSRIISTLKAYKESLNDYNAARLFGYPEWITFRGDALENMRFMNTTIYSRFYNDESSLRTKDLTAEYSRWYGTPMMNAIPVQGILGFDAGMYLIRSLNNSEPFPGTMPYSGIQSDFRFASDGSNAGAVNKALYLVNFRPSGITEKISL